MHPSFVRVVLVFSTIFPLLPTRGAESVAQRAPVRLAPAAAQDWSFPEDGVTFDTRFSAARLSTCTRLGTGEFSVGTSPENTPINPSAWFAFRVRASAPKMITLRLHCDGAPLRYLPKISVDGIRWLPLPTEAFTTGPKSEEGTLRLEVGPEPVWVAAQEMVTGENLEAWNRTLERLPFVSRAEIGRSVEGRPIHGLEINAVPAGTKPGFVIVIGRQHPPETTGSLALMRFVETLVGDLPLARRFRAKFALLVVPLVNPDGVAAGNWRHNMNGVDTNRDWGVFAQPETRAVRDAVEALRARGRIWLHLDFHSTFKDVFYTQRDDAPSQPAGFTQNWLEGIGRRVPSYAVNRSASSAPQAVTSHNWAHRAFGIPAITYEIGDNTERAMLQTIAAAAAESMMETLLAAPEPPSSR